MASFYFWLKTRCAWWWCHFLISNLGECSADIILYLFHNWTHKHGLVSVFSFYAMPVNDVYIFSYSSWKILLIFFTRSSGTQIVLTLKVPIVNIAFGLMDGWSMIFGTIDLLPTILWVWYCFTPTPLRVFFMISINWTKIRFCVPQTKLQHDFSS